MARNNPASDAGALEGDIYFPETDISQVNEPVTAEPSDSDAVREAVAEPAAALEGAVAETTADTGVTGAVQVVETAVESVFEQFTDQGAATDHGAVAGAATDQAMAAGSPDWNDQQQSIEAQINDFLNKFNEADPTEQPQIVEAHMADAGMIAQRAIEGFSDNDAAQAEGRNNDASMEGFAGSAGYAFGQIGGINGYVAAEMIGNHTHHAEELIGIR